MCFIVLAYEAHPRYRLVLATNRDELYERPTASAAYWDDHPGLLAGRDLKGGGTWLGITHTGRFSALTNYRERGAYQPEAPTRGTLVTAYLTGTDPPLPYLEQVQAEAARYNGFNLLVGDTQGVFYYGNRAQRIMPLEPGVYGLSNHLLDTPWPKIVRGKALLNDVLHDDIIDPEDLFRLLTDQVSAPDATLPNTGVGLTLERVLSPIFIASPAYGTRASTVVLVDYHGAVTFVERTHEPGDASAAITRHVGFTLQKEDASSD